MDFCSEPNVLRLVYVILLGIRIVTVLIPIVIIIMCSKDVFNTIMSKDPQGELKSKIVVIAKRLSAGLIIFFIPTIVNFAFNGLVEPDSEFATCIADANLETIKMKEKEKQEKLEEEKDKTKEELEEAAKEQAQKQQEEIEAEKKRQEEERQQQAQQQQQQSGGNQGTQNGSGYTPGSSSTQISPGVGLTQRTYTGSRTVKYWELVPEGISSSPALIVFLHGSGECGNMNRMTSVSFPKFMKEGYMSSYDAIFIAPNTSSCSWFNDHAILKELIDSTIAAYNVDRNHIIITGHSLGGNGAWNMVAQYPGFFSAAVPVSGCPSTSLGWSGFTGTPIRAYVGSSEGSYKSCNSTATTKVNELGGNVEYIIVPNTNHSTVVNIYKDSELINWMLSQ